MIEGLAAPGAQRVVVRVDGRVVRKLRLRGRPFVVDVDLPPREVSVRSRRSTGAAVERVGRSATSTGFRARPGRASASRGSTPGSRRTSAASRRASRARRPSTSRPTSGAAAAWNARATFPAASTLKLAIAVTLLTRVDGPPGPGTVLDGLVRRMLDVSDNESANRSLLLLGGSTSAGGHVVDAVMRSIGLERTVMYGGYVLGTSLGPPREIAAHGVPLGVVEQPYWGIGKATTAADLAQLHRALWLGSAGLGPLGGNRSGVSPEEARYLLYVLAHVGDRAKLGRLVGERQGVVVLHKAGWIDPARHDAGLIAWRGGIFVAAVMTHRGGGVGTRSDVLAGRVAQTALRRFSG